MSTHVPPDQALDMLAHRQFIRAIVRSLLRGVDGEEDVVQQTMLKACREAPRDRSRLRPWLARISRNLAFDHLRAKRRRERVGDHVTLRPGEPSPADVLQREEERQRVVRAVLALPQAYRSVLLMRYWDELPAAEIARRLGEPDATIRSRLHRGVAMLRKELDRGFGSRAAWVTALTPFAAPPFAAAGPLVATASGALDSGLTSPGLLGTATKISTAGALLMTKSKLLIGVTACAVVGLVAWLAWQSDGAPAPHPQGTSTNVPAVATGDFAGNTTTPPPDTATPDQPATKREAATPVGDLAVKGIVSHRGAPQPNFPVTLHWFAGTETDEEPVSEHELRTDSQGRFVWRGDARAELATIRVSAPQSKAQSWSDSKVVTQDTTEVSLKLSIVPLDRVLFGRVHDQAGEPIAGVRLSINGWPKSATVSDEDGRYQVGVPTRSYPLVVDAPRHRHRLINGYMPDDASRHEFDIELEPGVAFHGSVVDENDVPVAGARVGASGLLGKGVLTDAEGHFVLHGAAPDTRHQLTAKKTGYRPSSTTATPGGEASRIKMLPGLGLGLRVSDLEGNAIVGATVHIVPTVYSGWLSRGVTDADGRKQLIDLAPGPFDVIIQRPGFARDRRTVDAGKAAGDIAIALRPGFAVAGTVVNEAGDPMAGASVYAENPEADFGKRSVGTRATTDADGHFAVADLPPGACTVHAHLDGYSRASLAGVSNARTDLVLRVIKAPGVAGRVVDGVTGEPIPEFRVHIVANHEVQSLHISPKQFEDGDGRFRFDNWRMKAGAELFIEVAAQGYAPTRVRGAAQLDPPPNQNLIQLYAGATVTGVLRDRDTNAVIAGAELLLQQGDGKDELHRHFRTDARQATTDAQGHFDIAHVPAGSHRLTLKHGDYPPTPYGPFEVGTNDETVTIEPTMKSGVTLAGRVTGIASAAGWDILASNFGHSLESKIADDLTFAFRGLGPGHYQILIRAPEGRSYRYRAEVMMDDVTDLELELVAGTGSIRATVHGLTTGSASATRISEAEGRPTTSTRQKFNDGMFVFTGLAPGRYRVEVHDLGWLGMGQTEVEVGTGEATTEVEFLKKD